MTRLSRTTTLLIVIATLSYLQVCQSAQQIVSINPSTTTCPTTQYYDTTQYQCLSCPANSKQDSSGVGCACNSGSIINNVTRFDFLPTCSPCPVNMTPSSNQSRCMGCNSPAFYDTTIGSCVCPSGYKAIDTDTNGTALINITCSQCPANEFQGPVKSTIWNCTSCPHHAMIYNTRTTPWTCMCPTPTWITAADVCVSSVNVDALTAGYPLDYARQITFNNVVDINNQLTKVVFSYSDLFNYYYYYAAIGCWEDQDPTKCQILANLCTLQLYNEQSTVCQFYQYLTLQTNRTQANTEYNDQGWVDGMPWLYYYQKPISVVQTSNKVALTVSFKEVASDPNRQSSLTFYLARYAMNGTFLGFQELKTELSLCPMSHQDVLNMLQFGAITENVCEFSLNSLVQWNPENLPTEANTFFDLYIQDENGDLIDVPVLITNFVDRNGKTPNVGNTVLDSWRFVRRFLVYDTISGIDQVDGYLNNTVPTILRWASEIKIKITLDPTQKERIYVPYLQITYKEKATNLIHDSTTTSVKFIMDYYQSMSKFWKSILIAFIIFQVFILAIIAVKMVFFFQHNPPAMLKEKFLQVFAFKLVFTILDVWSEIMFWILFFVSAYWFVVYKLQQNAYVLLPSVDDWNQSYRVFYGIFGLILGFRFVSTIMRIVEQSTVDVFLIDWEKQKPQPQNQSAITNETGDSVTIWRTIFLLNEFNELQTQMRYLKPSTTLLWFGFFIKGLGWEWLSQADPNMTKVENVLQPQNLILMFFLSALVLLVIGAVQYVIFQFLSTFSSVEYQDFLDLCTLTNISLLIMDTHYHGYYIHGEAPWVNSDLVLSQLKKNLDKEGEGRLQKRGISDKDSGLQCYEVYFPAEVRKSFDDIYTSKLSLKKLLMINIQNMVSKNKQKSKQGESSINNGSGQPNLVVDESNNEDEKQKLIKQAQKQKSNQSIANEKEKEIAEQELKRFQISGQLKNYFSTIKLNPSTLIFEKNFFERFVNKIPSGVNLNNLKSCPVLVKDAFARWPSFTNVLYANLDYDILILYIMFFVLFDKVTGNSVISITIVYIIEKFLCLFRTWLGESNLARKTLIDEKFLV